MSTATNISFEDFSLQNSTYRTENIRYRHLANKNIDQKQEPRRGGFDVIDTFFTQKEISITGWVLSDSAANLRTAVDNLKKNLLTPEGQLDIEYGGSTLRYKATVSSIEVEEQHHHITRIPFNVSFLCLPWGTSTGSITDSKTVTSSPYNSTIVIAGSYGPFPVLKWTLNSTPSTTITKIKFENTTTDDYIEVSGLTLNSTNSFLEVDIENMTVKQGSTNVDFTGVFPSFDPSTNSYSTTVSGSGYSVLQTIVYYPTYL